MLVTIGKVPNSKFPPMARVWRWLGQGEMAKVVGDAQNDFYYLGPCDARSESDVAKLRSQKATLVLELNLASSVRGTL